MCGIAGVFQHGSSSRGSVTEPVLRAMNDTLRHRGPDGEGVFVSEDRRIGLANRRLAVIDPAHGHQPMFGPNGECLVFNGEIYNYPRLRRELEEDGAVFATSCDTEVILHLYARLGLDAVERLSGMFAFALWDPRRRRLALARDPVGEKPLYYTDIGGSLIFGSEIKAVLAHPAVTPEVNDAAIGPYLANLVTAAPATLFRGIEKLPPGAVAVFDGGGPTFERYRDLTFARAMEDVPLEEAAHTVRALLDNSLTERLMSDVPVGVLLSGGLDSTTLVGLLAERAQGMATFSVGFAGSSALDERPVARRVARHFGTDHHEVEVSEQDALEFLPDLVHHQDEPLGDPVCVPLSFVCGLARSCGVKVVLAGEGADELFWGYPSYAKTMALWPWIRAALAMPSALRAALPLLLRGERNTRRREVARGVARGRLDAMHAPGLTADERRLVLGNSAGSGWDLTPITDGERPLDSVVFDTQEYEFGLRLPELLLMRIDRFSMAHGVEARVPFLDPALIDYAYRLPLSHKLHHGETKRVMRQAVADVVPEWVLARRKQGFGAPIVEWLEARLGRLLYDLLDDPELARYFDIDEVRRLAAGGRSPWVLWPILNFALWHRHWIQKADLSEQIELILAAEVAR